MEDIVLEKVNEIFDEEERTKQYGYCTCKQCRMDVSCFVLNRIPPQYMISSRGLAHLRQDYQNNLQKTADLMGLINEGIKRVSKTRRPYAKHDSDIEEKHLEGPLFNFPTIVGRIFNGNNFEPVKDIEVHLLSDGEHVEMINPNWQNPYPIVDKTAGTFTFWPHPKPAKSLKDKRVFEYELFVEEPGFDEFHHFFIIEVKAEPYFNDSFHLQQTYTLEDLYMFPL
jgi:competence protein ComFB